MVNHMKNHTINPVAGKLASRLPNRYFWHGRRVLVTGHTGFKGAWLCLVLDALGARVSGFSLAPATPSAFAQLGIAARMQASCLVDLRDAASVAQCVRDTRPEIVLHLAAQALVGDGYRDPQGTYDTNVHGTVNLLQAMRALPAIAAAVIVTSDKVYRHDALGRPFTESDALGGHDPYSSSKAATEIAVASWRHSFRDELPAMATARAGNVIGGGDFAAGRLVPDLVFATKASQALVVRNPDATRPFQHVLDVVNGYLLLAESLATSHQKPAQEMPDAVNFGPQEAELRVRDLIDEWQCASGRALDWRASGITGMFEQPRLALDSRRAADLLDWRPRFTFAQAIAQTARWYDGWLRGHDMRAHSEAAVTAFLSSVSSEEPS